MLWFEPLLTAAVVLTADQAAKTWVLAHPRYAVAGATRPFLAIHCVINRRGASLPTPLRVLRAAAFALCVGFAVAALMQEPLRDSRPGAIGIGLALGGIAGNFIDLARRGGIVDFIAIGPLPVCNIAYLAIAGGVTLAGVVLLQWMVV